jgi:flagellar export protein FliJ
MKRFEFRLDGVLRVRRIREDVARAEALRANLALAAAEQRVADRDDRYRSLARPSGPMSQDAHAHTMWTLEQAAAATKFAARGRDHAAGEADVARAGWSQRRQELRAIERLHERALTAHRTELRRAEDRLSDELALVRHHTGRQWR